MAVYPYRKFKISLAPNSSKIQGLRVGDIVRRQYFDNQLQQSPDGTFTGNNVGEVYSLMCVLETGIDTYPPKDDNGNYIIPADYKPVLDADGNIVEQQQPWFIGALLEGCAPTSNELLDFVRITNLFDTSRSGALYLTASDAYSPFLDVIDGIGRNESLCWPADICRDEAPDSKEQYVLRGDLEGVYVSAEGDRSRIVRIKKVAGTAAKNGLTQAFYKYVTNPNMVLVSYKAKASRPITTKVSLEYANSSKVDGDLQVGYETDWKYYFHAITVDWSGRHLRTVNLDFDNLAVNDEVCISDFNIILLSSISNFSDSSKIRIGKLDGIVDPVFGRLDGYGSFLQKLFASQSAHISGTLTAGDENGFGSSFYAGKIHKNVFINSLNPKYNGFAEIANQPDDPISPTGNGIVLKTPTDVGFYAQSHDWYFEKDSNNRYTHIGKRFTFSFWVYCKHACVLDLEQNGHFIGAWNIPASQTLCWVRLHKTFELREPVNSLPDTRLDIGVVVNCISDKTDLFTDGKDIAADTLVADEQVIYITSPQLEKGEVLTQYQPTDERLNYTDDYGAWFDRGGIGGTIQNPLLRLNYDGKGGIATRQNSPDEKPSLALNQDGSGHIAHGHVSWDEQGNTTLDKKVRISWENLGDDTKKELAAKSIKIQGVTSFTLIGDAMTGAFIADPETITLSLVETNLSSTPQNRIWQYLDGDNWMDFAINANAPTITISPEDSCWGERKSLYVRCLVNVGGVEYFDTITINKVYTSGYIVDIVSDNGTVFKNNDCSTILTANVYFQGELLTSEYCQTHFAFKWTKYDIIDGEYVEDPDFWGNPSDENYIDPTQQQLALTYLLSGSDYFTCEVAHQSCFPYDFPICF